MEISTNPTSSHGLQEHGLHTFRASESRMASISETQSLDMHLVTAEGDTVTLSYDAYAAALYAQHGQVQADSEHLSAQWAEFGAGWLEQELTLSVEGDLNDQEQREIKKAIKAIGQMLNSFVNGHVAPTMARAGGLSGLETIASLDVNMAYERQVVTARQTDKVVAYNRDGDGKDLPVLAPPTGQGSLEAETESLVDKMADVIRGAQAPFDNMLKMTERMLEFYRQSMMQKDTLAADLFAHIKEQLKEALEDDEVFRSA